MAEVVLLKEFYTPIENFLDALGKLGKDEKTSLKNIHEYLLNNQYKVKKESLKKGGRYTYLNDVSGTILKINIDEEKAVLHIFGENMIHYAGFVKTLPPEIIESMKNGHDCKRIIDPKSCSPSCKGGFKFKINDTEYCKCRNFNFKFDMDNKNASFIFDFIKKECDARLKLPLK